MFYIMDIIMFTDVRYFILILSNLKKLNQTKFKYLILINI